MWRLLGLFPCGLFVGAPGASLQQNERKPESKLVKMNGPESRAAVGDRLKLLIRRTSVENLGELGFVRILVAVDLSRSMSELFRVVALKLLFNC